MYILRPSSMSVLTTYTGNFEVIDDLGHPGDISYFRFDIRTLLLAVDRPLKRYRTIVYLYDNVRRSPC